LLHPGQLESKYEAPRPLFALDGINHFYGKQRALGDISVSVKRGAVGLLGPNGAGKTTLIKTLLGLLDPDSGAGQVLGYDIRTQVREIRQRVGYMPEMEAAFASMTGLAAVIYAARLSGLPRRHAIRRAHEVLDYAGIEEARYRPTEGYSTGMKQRVKLAQTLVHDPEVVFLDEPTNGLGPKGRDDMLAIIDALSAIPVSVVLSSHLLNDVERVCDDVLLLVGGQIRHYGPISQFTAGQAGQYEVHVKQDGARLLQHLNNAEMTATYEEAERSRDRLLVELGDGQLTQFWQLTQSLDIQVRHFAPVRLSLEKAFMKFLGSDAQ
jgi:ABC-2 type transport system ATP-binding protein